MSNKERPVMKIRNFAWSTLLYTTLYVNDDREDDDNDDDGPFRYYVTRYVEMVGTYPSIHGDSREMTSTTSNILKSCMHADCGARGSLEPNHHHHCKSL